MAVLDTFTEAYIETMLWSSTTEAVLALKDSLDTDSDTYTFCSEKCKEAWRLTDDPEHKMEEFYWLNQCDPHSIEWCAECGNSLPTDTPMDRWFGTSDMAPETLTRIAADCERFQKQNDLHISENYKHESEFDEWALAGHDFWLTRNGHGAGFWDGDWKEPAATKLDEASKAFGEQNLYVGDDEKLYLLGGRV